MIGEDRVAFIVGGGPSAGRLDLEQLRGAHVFVINDCFRRLPWAPVVFTADGRYYAARIHEILAATEGRVIAAVPAHFRSRVMAPRLRRRITFVDRIPGVGFSAERGAVFFSDNSGFACLGHVAGVGYRRIALIGFDMTTTGHWHGGYPWGPAKTEDYPKWARAFDTVAPLLAAHGADVVNVNPDSAIRSFRFATFDDVLSGAAWA